MYSMCVQSISIYTPLLSEECSRELKLIPFLKTLPAGGFAKDWLFAVTHSAAEKTLSVLFVFYIPVLIQPELLCAAGTLKDLVMVPL